MMCESDYASRPKWLFCIYGVYLHVLSIQGVKDHDSGEHTSSKNQTQDSMICNALVLLFIMERSARDYLFRPYLPLKLI